MGRHLLEAGLDLKAVRLEASAPRHFKVILEHLRLLLLGVPEHLPAMELLPANRQVFNLVVASLEI